MIWVPSQVSHCEVSGRKSWKQWQLSCQTYSSVWLMRAFERQLARAGLAATSLSIRHPLLKALLPSLFLVAGELYQWYTNNKGPLHVMQKEEQNVANHNWNSKKKKCFASHKPLVAEKSSLQLPQRFFGWIFCLYMVNSRLQKYIGHFQASQAQV